jgi:dihydrofolate reductase
MRTALIVAMTRGGLIGRGLSLPWHWPEDLRHFKRTTRGHTVVMGRATFQSLVEQFGGPLKNRTNLVVSRERGGPAPDGRVADGGRWFRSLEDALAWAGRHPPEAAPPSDHPAAGPADEIFILGGAAIFRLALSELRPLPDRLVVTWVPDVPVEPGDVHFPFVPPEPFIEERYRRGHAWRDESGQLEFVVYERRDASG